jgi:phosphate acyltransferase
MRIALDAMGGDFAPKATILGAIEASKITKDEIILVGSEPIIRAELENQKKLKIPNIKIVHAAESIAMDESPSQALRQKKDSSLAVAARLVSEGKADALVSAGNSGAVMAFALLYLGRIPGVSRPAILTMMPSLAGACAILDVGANVDCKPKHLFQFALMGDIYVKTIFDVPKPRVGLLSIGEEPTKGNEASLEAFGLLKGANINFIGNVEGRDIGQGKTDVAVCDGFTGNILLKFGEGIAEMILKVIREELKAHPLAWASLPFLWAALKDLRKKMDYTEYGGAPLLGVNGVTIISHGSSNPKAIKNAIMVASRFAEKNVNKEIAEEIAKYENKNDTSNKEPVNS